MEVKTTVEFSDKEIRDILVKEANKSLGKDITGASGSVQLTTTGGNGTSASFNAVVSFNMKLAKKGGE